MQNIRDQEKEEEVDKVDKEDKISISDLDL
jgi:hypothetical protein